MNENDLIESDNNGLKTTSIKSMRTSKLGVYVYERDNGKLLADEELNILSIDSYYGDEVRKEILVKTAHAILFREGLAIGGKAKFLDGQHKCSDDDFYEQIHEFRESGIL